MYQGYRGNFPGLSIMRGEAESLHFREVEAKLLAKERFKVLPERIFPLDDMIERERLGGEYLNFEKQT